MQYIELTIYVILPEPTAFKGVVERQAVVTFKGHPRVVVPLAQMLQQAAQVLGGRGLEGQTKEPESQGDAPKSKSRGVKDESNGIH